MEKQKIRILHFVRDDRFVDGPLNCFDKDGRFESEVFLVVNSADYKFRLIKNTDRIKLLYNRKMVKATLQRKDYDVVFFYSLTNYKIINYIPDDKIVIWWAWGFDIYGPKRFLDILLYKPLTGSHLKQVNCSFADRIKALLMRIPFILSLRDGSRNKAIRRLDYFQPVIHTEYEMLQKIPGFKAKEFYYPFSHNYKIVSDELPKHENNIILGHSATYTENHLDVWDKVKVFIPKDSTIYIPISYGKSSYAEYLTRVLNNGNESIVFMKELLPPLEYFKIVDSCSYAIFGVLRQAAMGNIFRCVMKGVKLFLYKDSMPYEYLKQLGCVVFSIEDIDENSFRTPLTQEQVNNNRLCLLKDREYVETVREKAIKDIQETVFARRNNS